VGEEEKLINLYVVLKDTVSLDTGQKLMIMQSLEERQSHMDTISYKNGNITRVKTTGHHACAWGKMFAFT